MPADDTMADVEAVRADVDPRLVHGRYAPPRVVKSRQITEVTGQAGAVSSGAPAPRQND